MIWTMLCAVFIAVLPYCSPLHELKTLAAMFWLAVVLIYAFRDI